MERSTPVRKPHTSSADLLTWPETPISDSPNHPSSVVRSHKQSDGIRKVVFGVQGISVIEFATNVKECKEKPLEGFHVVVDVGNGAGGFFADIRKCNPV